MKTSGSAMAERPRDACSAILRGWVTLNLDFRLKGYVLCQRLWTVRWGMVILQLFRWMFWHKETL